MEMEFFCVPGTDDAWLKNGCRRAGSGTASSASRKTACACDHTKSWPTTARPPPTSSTCFPFGWGELEGIANRTDFDLRQHQRGVRTPPAWQKEGGELTGLPLADEEAEYHKGKLSYFDDEKKQRYIPTSSSRRLVPTARRWPSSAMPTTKTAPDANGKVETPRRAAPASPLSAGQGRGAAAPAQGRSPRAAEALYKDLRKRWMVEYDESAAIGKRYRRQDEIGTPLCITIDHQTLTDGTVTVRARDSMTQQRIPESQVASYLQDLIGLP